MSSSTPLSLATARRAVDAALGEGRRLRIAVAVAAVDGGGHPVALARDDGAPFATMALAVDKAWTAAGLGAPSDQWSASTAPGNEDWGMVGGVGGRVLVLPGGLPVRGGAIGVSGGTSEQDRRCAQAGADAVGP